MPTWSLISSPLMSLCLRPLQNKHSAAPWLGLQPTFFVSSGVPLLYLSACALVESLPTVPELSLFTELPLSVFDALTRAILLCNFIPPMITAHPSLAVSTSPHTLLLAAFVSPELYIRFPNKSLTRDRSLLMPVPSLSTHSPFFDPLL